MSAKQTSVSKRVEQVRFRNRSRLKSGIKRRANVWKNILNDICDQCSLHGLNHIIRDDRSTGEKLVFELKKKNVKISINMMHASGTQQLYYARYFIFCV